MKYREPVADRGKFFIEEYTVRQGIEQPLEIRLHKAFGEYRPDINCYFGTGCIYFDSLRIDFEDSGRAIYEREVIPFVSTTELLEALVEHNIVRLSTSDIAYISRHTEQYHNPKKAKRYEQRFHKK